MRQGELIRELADVIGEAGLVDLAEAFGGTRLYVPATIEADHELAAAIGLRAARRLAAAVGGAATIRVPLMREERVLRYVRQGRSNAQIARALGITETGVDKLKQRLRGADRLD